MNKKDKYAIYKFVKYVEDTLGIQNKYNVSLSENRKNFKTFAYYNPGENLIAVYVKGRAVPDIMRSIAHEMVHHYDHQTGKANQRKNPDVGIFHDDSEKSIDPDDIENRANAIAGSLVKKFGYENPKLNVWNDANN